MVHEVRSSWGRTARISRSTLRLLTRPKGREHRLGVLTEVAWGGVWGGGGANCPYKEGIARSRESERSSQGGEGGGDGRSQGGEGRSHPGSSEVKGGRILGHSGSWGVVEVR